MLVCSLAYDLNEHGVDCLQAIRLAGDFAFDAHGFRDDCEQRRENGVESFTT
jgi:hypothetical protein